AIEWGQITASIQSAMQRVQTIACDENVDIDCRSIVSVRHKGHSAGDGVADAQALELGGDFAQRQMDRIGAHEELLRFGDCGRSALLHFLFERSHRRTVSYTPQRSESAEKRCVPPSRLFRNGLGGTLTARARYYFSGHIPTTDARI